MTLKIIDTNAIVIANGQSTSVVESCIDAARVFVSSAFEDGVIGLDDGDEILEEYLRKVGRSRPHDLGALFVIRLLQIQHDPMKVRRLHLTKDGEGSYTDFPEDPALSAFDVSDRKFAVLALLARSPVINAVDSDWVEFLPALENNGISVAFLCGSNVEDWFV